MLQRVECDDANRVVELPRHEVGYDHFEVYALDLGLAINTPKPCEAINYEVDGLVRAVLRMRMYVPGYVASARRSCLRAFAAS